MVANAQKLAALRGDMIALNDIENPFNAWLNTLIAMAAELAKLSGIAPANAVYKNYTDDIAGYDYLNPDYLPNPPARQGQLGKSPLSLGNGIGGGMQYTDDFANYNYLNPNYLPTSASNGGTIVNLTVTGSVTTERDLVAAITQGLYAQQASGTPVNYSTAY